MAVTTSTDAKSRLQALRELLDSEVATTQEELRKELEERNFEVNQSTISRDLRRLGAIKITDGEGNTTYRLSADAAPAKAARLSELVHSIQDNGHMIVVNTSVGCASLIARHIDSLRSDDIMGTIAGDDTVFIAPANVKRITLLVKQIRSSLETL